MDSINWRRLGRICVVAIPVIVWDSVYWTLKVLYNAATRFDKVGGEFIDNYVNGDS